VEAVSLSTTPSLVTTRKNANKEKALLWEEKGEGEEEEEEEEEEVEGVGTDK
jgi:hypothetical protein